MLAVGLSGIINSEYVVNKIADCRIGNASERVRMGWESGGDGVGICGNGMGMGRASVMPRGNSRGHVDPILL